MGVVLTYDSHFVISAGVPQAVDGPSLGLGGPNSP
jgi:hypothetical protein